MDVQTEEDRKGMEAALERARENPPSELDSKLEQLTKLWEGESKPVEETPSKETGDAKPVREMEGLDLSDPNAVGLKAPSGGALDVISGGSVDEPKGDAGQPPPMPPLERPTEPWAALKHDLDQGAKAKPSMDPLEAKMRAAGWAPRASSTPPDWDTLQKNLQDAQGRAEAQRTIQQSFHAVAPRFQADPNAGSEDIAAAKAPLEMAQEKQRFEAQQLAADQHRLSSVREQEQRDANSAVSKRAREALRPIFEMSGKVPEDFDMWTAADVEQHAKTLTPIAADVSREGAAKTKAEETAKAKTQALQDRQNVMYKQYVDDPSLNLPDDERERRRALIASLHDVGDAQSVQTALEGRATRETTQTAQEKARTEAQAHSDKEAAIASARSLGNQISLKEYEAKHKAPTAEQLTQLEGINKSDGALDVFEKGLHSTDTATGKLAANFPKAAGALGVEGSDFDSLRKGTAVALARGLEGGTARPGNVEIIDSMLPNASDSPEVKAHKMANVRAFVKNNREAFMKTAQVGGTNLQPEPVNGPPPTGSVTLFNKKTRRSGNVSKAKADEIMKAEGGSDYQIIGEANP